MSADTLRLLTVRQPYAWAIVHGGKTPENRSRNIAGGYRGPIAVHVSKRVAPLDLPPVEDLHLGHVIGVVDLVDVHHAEDCYQRDIDRLARLYREDPAAVRALPDSGAGGLLGRVRLCSPWALPDHHHLVLTNPRPLPHPIPARGRLSLWRPDAALLAAIREQIGDLT